MEFFKKRFFLILAALFVPLLLYFGFLVFQPKILNIANKVYTKNFIYNNAASAINSVQVAPSENLPEKLEKPPAILKAIYLTGWSAGSKAYLGYLDKLFKTTQINAVVIDIKDASGIISYKTNARQARQYGAYWPQINNIDELVQSLHNQGIYVIGRIVVFEDPILAKNRPDLAVYDKSKPQEAWKDNRGLAWVDPSSQEVYDYNIEIAKDAASRGLDEINFDYVRFPTDGDANNMGFPLWNQQIPKYLIIKGFFKKLRESFPDTKISIDLFGQTATNTDDMGIGQIFEDVLEYFDYVCPMIYPSHYAKGFLGYENPADKPYEIITNALNSALARKKVFEKINNINQNTLHEAKIRPWLQDFSLGATTYDAAMVKKEIQAVTDSMKADFNGYMLWNASNVYTVDAIAKPGV